MNIKKFQNTLNVAVILSETSHVFCCVLPTVFSLVSLLAGIGIVTAVPLWLQNIHEALHQWEVPLIVASGLIVVLGWALHWYSNKIDCHDTGCGHGPCEPKKKKNNTILKVATILFLINVSVYVVFHRGMDAYISASDTAVETHEGHVH